MSARRRTASMRAAVYLLELFLVAVVVALVVTVTSVSAGAAELALGAVTPLVFLGIVFLRYCRLGRAWAFAGACALGAVGVALRLVVSTQPTLEVGGGLPVPVALAYVVLGSLVSLTSYESVLDLKRKRP